MASLCSECGSEIDDDTGVCPACSSETTENANENVYAENSNVGNIVENNDQNSTQQNGQKHEMGKWLKVPFVLGVIWLIFASVEGMLLIQMSPLYIERYSNSLYFADAVTSFYWTLFVGVLLLISSILIILCCIHMYKLEEHKRTSIYYVLGFLIAIISGIVLIYAETRVGDVVVYDISLGIFISYGYGIIVGVLGLIFYLIIRKEKDRFTS
ncbi:hypothetical protein Mpt1_c04780 [Candidatus Methanoplasma termitum]|uniref:Zinc-ribbon domain-containing protein n=1 Tax=Candidatus Methanoplasma termitum TaxID=1577791 RepID=A0A0A7LB31_9ARCH|nr:zinc ribbon domain-containing protein [Candidatus Methanoplasma termitum]AIZ56370.1 hypothetical protein Mpt1_c04780 [Candidatus Methanoplasma termitum]